MRTEEEIVDLVNLYKNIQYNLAEVRELRAKYEGEYKARGYRPSYDRKQTDKQLANKNFRTGHLERRYSPDVGEDECVRVHRLLPVGWFNIHTVVTPLDMEILELRRCFFWMRKRQMMQYDTETTLFRKRNLHLE